MYIYFLIYYLKKKPLPCINQTSYAHYNIMDLRIYKKIITVYSPWNKMILIKRNIC